MHGVAVGREVEIESGWRRLSMGIGSGPVAMLVEGEPGIGKSEVLAAIAARATEVGVRLLQARPVEPETTVSYAAFGDLLAGVTDSDLAGLPEPQRRALEVACLRREPTRPIDDVRLIGTALAGLLRSMAERSDLLLAIDDVQWLDSPSSRALEFGLRRVSGSRLGVLLARRSTTPAAVPLGLESLRPTGIETIALGPLSPAALRTIIEERLSLRLTRAQVRRLHQLSGGNALFAMELARTVAGASDEDELWRRVADHADVAQLILDRIRSLPLSTRRTLAAAAALGDPRIDTIGMYLGSDRVATAAIRRAAAAGITHQDRERLRFDHPLLAAAAYGALALSERRDLHADLAAVVTDSEERARHLALAHDTPDEAIADAISAGARRASERGAQDAAAELAEAALRLTPADPASARGARAMTAAVHLARAGELRRARELCESLVRGLDASPQRAALLRLVGEIRLQEDSFPEGIKILRQAAKEAGDDPGLRFPIDLQLAFALVNLLGPRDAVPHARRALEDAERLGIPRLVGTALAVNEITRFFVGEGFDLDVADRAIALEEPDAGDPALFRPSLVCGMALSAIGQHLRAAGLFRVVAADARLLGDEAGLVPALMYVSWNALFSGAMEEASAAADDAVVVARSLGGDVALAQAFTATSRVAERRGDVQAARRDALHATELYNRAGWESGLIWPAGVLGSLAWSQGDAAGTVDILRAPVAAHMAAGFVAEVLPFWADLVEAYIALGMREEAETVMAPMAPSPSQPVRHVVAAIADRGRALILSKEGRLNEALGAMDSALAHLAAIDPLPYEIARNLLVRGRIERRAKRRAAARVSFEAALAGFDALGARQWAVRTREEIGRLGSRAPNDLSDTEAVVARLAARGLTNREVAEMAFVTAKSVEGILARAYAKLGIRSRAELGAWAATLPEDDVLS